VNIAGKASKLKVVSESHPNARTGGCHAVISDMPEQIFLASAVTLARTGAWHDVLPSLWQLNRSQGRVLKNICTYKEFT
jgi:hypothetical protein